MNKADDDPRDEAASGRERFHDAVVETLGRRIVGGELPRGSSIGTEQALCEEFGTSRTVVREAVQILSAKGVLETTPRIGTRVMPANAWHLLDPQVLEWQLVSSDSRKARTDLYELRTLFEPTAAELAAQRSTPQDRQRMKHALLGMALATSQEEKIEHDVAFHKAILTATGNALFQALGTLISAALRQVFKVGFESTPDEDRRWLKRHQDVYEAIARREPDVARAHMTTLLAEAQVIQNLSP